MLKSVLLLTSGSLIGKVFGIVREVLLASYFGTSAITDAYRAVLALISAPIHMFATEPLTATFIPRFSRDVVDSPGSAWNLFTVLTVFMLVGSIFVAALIIYFTEELIGILLPGFEQPTIELAIEMLRILALGLPFCVLSYLLISLCAARKNYYFTALRPLIFNIGVIIAIVTAYYLSKPTWIAWGFSASSIIFSIIVFITMVIYGVLIKKWYTYCSKFIATAMQFLKLLKPMALFSLILQLNLLLEKALASLIAPGAVAAIDYAKLIPESTSLLFMAPVGLLSLSEMPGASKEAVTKKSDRLSAYTLILLVPLSAFVGINADEIIHIIYGRGAFDADAQYVTARALTGMSVGLWAYCLSYVLIRIFNAQFRNNEVLKISIVAIAINALFNIVAYEGLGVLALGLGFSLYGIVSSLLLLRGLTGMIVTRKVALICMSAILPYMGVAMLVNSLDLAMWYGLLLQTIWAVIYWMVVMLLFVEPRVLILELFRKIFMMRQS